MIKVPHVQAIYVATSAGEPMMSIQSAELTKLGIKGDRYESGIGAYSNSIPQKVRHISIITLAGINAANELLSSRGEPTFTAIQTRRNIVLEGICSTDLNNLVGRDFQLGCVLLKGVELCDPCQRPAHLLRKSDFINAFAGHGGLRAQIISSGTFEIGDRLFQEDENE